MYRDGQTAAGRLPCLKGSVSGQPVTGRDSASCHKTDIPPNEAFRLLAHCSSPFLLLQQDARDGEIAHEDTG